MKCLVLAAALCAATALADIPAKAATIYVTENEMGPFGINSYDGGTLGWTAYFSGFNGQMNITANAGGGPGLPLFTLSVWCIDQPGFIGLGPNPSVDGTPIIYTIEPLESFTTDFSGHSITPTQAAQMAALATIADRRLRESPGDPVNAIFANAIQAAITNIEYGSTSDGGPLVNAETTRLLNWVEALTPTQLSGFRAVILFDEKNQKLISAVPEPVTLSLFGGALAALVFASRASSRRINPTGS